MNDFKLEFKLVQQTPHLHFLHRQAGQTLRLTELKAKLDRLIARYVFGDADDKKQSAEAFEKAREYLVGFRDDKPRALESKWKEEHFRAFDYRINLDFPTSGKEEMWAISTPSTKFGKVLKNESSDEVLSDTPYFADNDKTDMQSEELKKGIFYTRPIGLRVFSFHDVLLEAVSEFLPLLFALENFGCRQSKGFGGYWLDEKDFEASLKVLIEKGEILGAWTSKRTFRSDDRNEIFRQISKDYRILKSGFNHPNDPGQYKKSLLFEYFAAGNIRWEKRKIKQDINKVRPGSLKQTRKDPIDINNGRDVNNWDDPPGIHYDYRYVRALLGLAEQYEFQAASYGDKIKVKIAHPEIDRFRSPITVKVVNGRIYWLAIAGQTQKVEGKTFEFTAEQGSTTFFRNSPMAVPAGFDLAQFLDQKMPLISCSKLPL